MDPGPPEPTAPIDTEPEALLVVQLFGGPAGGLSEELACGMSASGVRRRKGMMKPPPSVPAGSPVRDRYARPTVDVASYCCGQSHWREKGKPSRVAYGITRVSRWTRVGSTSLVWYDDPAAPDRRERWRQFSTIVSITPLPDERNTTSDPGSCGRRDCYRPATRSDGDDC